MEVEGEHPEHSLSSPPTIDCLLNGKRKRYASIFYLFTNFLLLKEFFLFN